MRGPLFLYGSFLGKVLLRLGRACQFARGLLILAQFLEQRGMSIADSRNLILQLLPLNRAIQV